MFSGPIWFAVPVPAWRRGTAILRTEVARGQRIETLVSIEYAKAVVETPRVPLWQAIPSGRELITREMQNLDERGDSIEVPMMPGLVLRGLMKRVHEWKHSARQL